MLERTAAGLDTCNLRRLLSTSGRSSKLCRQLQPGFWLYSSSVTQLSKSARAAHPDPADPSPRLLQSGFLASASIFYLLYPKDAYTLLRRLYPILPRPRDGSTPGATLRTQYFSSSAPVAESYSRKPTSPPEAAQSSEQRGIAIQSVSQDEPLRRQEEPYTMANLETDAEPPSTITASATNHAPVDEPDADDPASPKNLSICQSLQDLLWLPEEERCQEVWDLYHMLHDDQRHNFRRSVIIYLSKTSSIVGIGRAVSLFNQMPAECRDDEVQAAGVFCLMRSGDTVSAINQFNIGLEQRGLSGGLEYLLADFIIKRQWPVLVDVWQKYFSAVSRRGSDAGLNDAQLPQLESIPDLARHYLAFEKYVEAKTSGSSRAAKTRSTSRRGLEALRRKLAESALKQPCQPNEAAAILELWNHGPLYQHYLVSMIDRWKCGLTSRDSLKTLPDIYKRYRTLPDVTPPVSLLRGMFNLYYPTNTAGLEEVYCDWHIAWGDLDEWGFERYLQFHARSGHVLAVKDLWARYVARFPEVLKTPRAFQSTMNVYAQTGDITGAEGELRVMTEHYDVMPDITIWNLLLKCYTIVGDFPRVLQCFEEIQHMYHPNSYTYAQVMTMAANKGDLETVLDFFNRAQDAQLHVSREMAMALVTAYCRNDKVMEAEAICTELAERKATSTGAWNQLLHISAMRGQLAKCSELLEAMKKFGLAWNRHTHEILLHALVKVDQIQPAYHLLRMAYKEKLFPVGPEHFEVVMAGAVRTGEFPLVDAILSHMRRAGHPVTLNAQVALLEAALQKAPLATRTRTLAKGLVGLLRSMLPAHRGSSSEHEVTGMLASAAPGNLAMLRKQTKSIGRAVRLLVEWREITTAEELVNVYADIFPEYKVAFPSEVASALMLGYLNDNQLDRVFKMWDQTWKSVLARCQRPDAETIYPAHEYELSRPILIVAKAFRKSNDGGGLLKCITKVTAAGFKLTRSSWNLVICYLANMGQWERAMEWCETKLMPHWRGWSAGRLNLQERRNLKNTRLLGASKEAVFSLQKEWLKLRKLGAWSGEVSGRLSDIEQKHPLLHNAFVTTDHENLPATWVLPKRESLNKAIKEMLKPLLYAELRAMKKALVRQLRIVRRARWRRRMKSPFHVVTGKSEDEVHTKEIGHTELRHLDAAVRARLKQVQGEPGQPVPSGEDGKENEAVVPDQHAGDDEP